MNEDDDMEILSLLQTDPHKAITDVMAAHGGLVFGVLRRKGLSDEDAKDVAQDVWVNFSQKWHTFDPSKGKFIGWLANVASNKAIDYIRRNSRYQRHMDEAERRQKHLESQSPTAADTTIEDLEMSKTLQQAMNNLPENQRRALEACYMRGMSQREAAEELGLPLGIVKAQLQYGLQKLRSLLQPA